jgi:hypothetical protein
VVEYFYLDSFLSRKLDKGYGKRVKVSPQTWEGSGTEIFNVQIPSGKKALVYDFVIVSDTNCEIIVDEEYSDYFEHRYGGAFQQVPIGAFFVNAQSAAKTIHVKVQAVGGSGSGGKASVSMKWIEY